MKKKFDDGGSVRTGGKYTASGDGPLEWQADVPVVAEIGPRVGGPIGAGLAGIQDGPNVEAALAGLGSSRGMGMLSGMDRPDVTARPMGLMVPSNVPRGLGSSIGTLGALRAAGMKKGGTVKKMAKGGSASSASKRGDGCAVKGKTKGRFV